MKTSRHQNKDVGAGFHAVHVPKMKTSLIYQERGVKPELAGHDLGQLADLLARVDRLGRLVARLMAEQPDALSPAIRSATNGDWFIAGEVWRLAQAGAFAADATGAPRPELADALERAGVRSAHALGRWLAAREGVAFERGKIERGGVQWRVLPEADVP